MGYMLHEFTPHNLVSLGRMVQLANHLGRIRHGINLFSSQNPASNFPNFTNSAQKRFYNTGPKGYFK